LLTPLQQWRLLPSRSRSRGGSRSVRTLGRSSSNGMREYDLKGVCLAGIPRRAVHLDPSNRSATIRHCRPIAVTRPRRVIDELRCTELDGVGGRWQLIVGPHGERRSARGPELEPAAVIQDTETVTPAWGRPGCRRPWPSSSPLPATRHCPISWWLARASSLRCSMGILLIALVATDPRRITRQTRPERSRWR
jgi:hypothetical protein